MISDEIMYVGIDPQPSLLAVYICNSSYQTLDWFNQRLQKKESFKNAQSWQEYIIEVSTELTRKLVQTQNKYRAKIMMTTIEQQRGRVNSMIEQSLLMACKIINLPVSIVHPKTWKAVNNIKPAGSNYQNKKMTVDLAYDRYVAWCSVSQQNPDTKRVHDLCDAYYICLTPLRKAEKSNLLK